jgi:hypothetical protein
MEDYFRAFNSRRVDVDVLLSSNPCRTTAAAHLGGIAIECQLKALLLDYHNISAWGQPSIRPRDPQHGQPIPRPGHTLIGSLKQMSIIYRKARADQQFLVHLDRVMHPTGATYADFIDLRYAADELNYNTMFDWRASFYYVLGWLKKNKVLI